MCCETYGNTSNVKVSKQSDHSQWWPTANTLTVSHRPIVPVCLQSVCVQICFKLRKKYFISNLDQ